MNIYYIYSDVTFIIHRIGYKVEEITILYKDIEHLREKRYKTNEKEEIKRILDYIERTKQ